MAITGFYGSFRHSMKLGNLPECKTVIAFEPYCLSLNEWQSFEKHVDPPELIGDVFFLLFRNITGIFNGNDRDFFLPYPVDAGIADALEQIVFMTFYRFAFA